MTEEQKKYGDCCADGQSGCCQGMHRGTKSHLLTTLGIAALVYGVVSYFSYTNDWSPYTEWIIVGLVLLSIGILKKRRLMNTGECCKS